MNIIRLHVGEIALFHLEIADDVVEIEEAEEKEEEEEAEEESVSAGGSSSSPE